MEISEIIAVQSASTILNAPAALGDKEKLQEEIKGGMDQLDKVAEEEMGWVQNRGKKKKRREAPLKSSKRSDNKIGADNSERRQ